MTHHDSQSEECFKADSLESSNHDRDDIKIERLIETYKRHFDPAILLSALHNLGIESTQEMLHQWSHQYQVFSKEFTPEDIDYIKTEYREAYKKFDFLLACIPHSVGICRVFFSDCLDVLDRYMMPTSEKKRGNLQDSSSSSDGQGTTIEIHFDPLTAWD